MDGINAAWSPHIAYLQCPGNRFYKNFRREVVLSENYAYYMGTGNQFSQGRGWSGGAIVLGKLRNLVGQGPTVLVVGAGGGVWTFFPSSIFSLFFLPLSGRRLDID